jgi:hypothetical protein
VCQWGQYRLQLVLVLVLVLVAQAPWFPELLSVGLDAAVCRTTPV